MNEILEVMIIGRVIVRIDKVYIRRWEWVAELGSGTGSLEEKNSLIWEAKVLEEFYLYGY